jgi:hypothetical protein
MCRRHICTVSDRHKYAASIKGVNKVTQRVKEVTEGVVEVKEGGQ